MKTFSIGDKVFANGWRNDADDHDHEFGTNIAIEKWVKEKAELTIMEGPNERNGFKGRTEIAGTGCAYRRLTT